MVSEKLRAAVKLAPEPAYKIAHKAGLNPSTLSKLLCGIDRVRPGDSRIVRVGEVLGLSPDDCFCGGGLDDET